MKNILSLIFICSVTFVSFSQTTIYDPYVGIITVSPSSPYSNANPPFIPVSGTATFTIGAKTGTDFENISWGSDEGCTDQACKLVVVISTTVNKTNITGLPVGGTWVSKFTWGLSGSNILTGTQKSDVNGGDIAPGTSGTIIIPIQHIASSSEFDPIGVTHPCDQPGNNCTLGFTQGFNGVVVNIQPPSQPSNNYPASLQADDNNGAYVFARTKLPLQYADLTLVNKQESGIQLLWKTINESNNKEFEIERKYDNSDNWLVIGKSMASGNTTGETIYKFFDNTYAYRPRIYYRVKAVDNDGKFVYTNTKSINLSNVLDLKISGFPNPVQHIYHLSFNAPSDAPLQIEIIDLSGKVFFKQKALAVKGYNQYDLEMKGIAAGTYFVKVSGKEIHQVLTVVKTE